MTAVTEIVLVVAGVSMVAAVFADITATVLAPDSRGRLSAWASKRVWWVVVRAGDWRLPGLFRIGGALAVVASVIVWIAGLWLGFGLMFLALEPSVVTAPDALGESGLFVRALYLSGTSLTTVGFGDLVAASDLTRFLVVAEAAAGLAAVTAAISYILSVYPLVSRKRAAATRTADWGADRPERVARLLIEADDRWLAQLRDDLIVVNQDLRRFPALYYFHASRSEEELTPLIRAACLAVVNLEWCLAAETGPGLRAYSEPLRRAVTRLIADLQEDFEIPAFGRLDDVEVTRRLGEVREASRVAAGVPLAQDDAGPELRELVAHCEAFLAGLASVHGYRAASLTDPPPRDAGARDGVREVRRRDNRWS